MLAERVAGAGGEAAGGGGAGGPRVRKVMTLAINLIYEFFKQRDRVSVWLYENTNMRIEGIIVVCSVCLYDNGLILRIELWFLLLILSF